MRGRGEDGIGGRGGDGLGGRDRTGRRGDGIRRRGGDAEAVWMDVGKENKAVSKAAIGKIRMGSVLLELKIILRPYRLWH